MSKDWKLKPSVPQEIVEKFPELSQLTVQLLYNRGLVNELLVEDFLHPQYQNLHSPFLFREMQKAVERVWQAIERHEKIVVYSDYDADAVTANAVLQQTFRYLGMPIISYIPDRFTEGYGLNIEAFEKLKAQGASVVITVDCGTNSVDVADFCNREGIDLIITDHHEITGETPSAFALVNPKNPLETYPDNQITGVGVSYKLACGILSMNDTIEALRLRTGQPATHVAGWDKWLLDLVAIGTVADCHSLLGENRILVKFGLHVLAKTKWLGLKVLLEQSGVQVVANPPDTYTLGFIVAPRINAAGRLEHADIALKLLLSEDYAEALEYAQRLEQINKRRQDITSQVVSEAKSQAELILDRKIILVTGADWPKGVVGLVAGRLVESYKKPVLVLEKGEQESTGSARTFGDFDIVACLKEAAPYLTKFGGHKQAAGLTLQNEHLEKFYACILEYAEANIDESVLPTVALEARLDPKDLNSRTYEEIASFEPFGVENMRPKFLLENATVISFRTVGASSQHLQVQLAWGQVIIETIGFNMGYLANTLTPGVIIHVAAELIEDSWNGRKKLKLKLADIQLQTAFV